MASIVVAGALANKHGNGGAAWTRLSWALGLKRLGYDVLFAEQIAPATCVDERGARCSIERSVNLAYFTAVTRRFGLDAGLIVEGTRQSFGLAWDQLIDAAERAETLVNISGHLTIPELKRRFRNRIFIDLDPGYTQFWHEEGLAADRLANHDFYFSVGENIGEPFCDIPTGGITWRPIRQPVLLDEWPVAPTPLSPPRFTTVASWRGPLGRVEHRGTLLGAKAHEFRKFLDLPTLSDGVFEIALDVDDADQRDLDSLKTNGWTVVDPRSVVPDPLAFRRYVQQSSAEFSVAQGIYVETQSGWFSDRTVRYLASGKPALVQDTGWSRKYPSSCGLLSFRTLDQAVDGARRITRDYQAHSRAARAIAEEFFDSNRVLSEFMAAVTGRSADDYSRSTRAEGPQRG